MDWLIRKIERLQPIGFFEDESSTEVLDRVVEASKNSYFGNIKDYEGKDNLIYVLTTYDNTHTWFVEDFCVLGAEPSFKTDFYRKVFKRLEVLSQGIFQPKNLKIKACGYCEGRDKRLDIRFLMDEEPYTINFCVDGDAFVFSFLVELNEIIEPTGYSFTYRAESYGSLYLYFLRHEQKKVFKELLGDTLDLTIHHRYWLDRAQYSRDQKEYNIAYVYFKKAIAQEDYNPYAISEFAEFLVDRNKPKEAMGLWKKSVERLKRSAGKEQLGVSKEEWWIRFFEERLEEQKTKL